MTSNLDVMPSHVLATVKVNPWIKFTTHIYTAPIILPAFNKVPRVSLHPSQDSKPWSSLSLSFPFSRPRSWAWWEHQLGISPSSAITTNSSNFAKAEEKTAWVRHTRYSLSLTYISHSTLEFGTKITNMLRTTSVNATLTNSQMAILRRWPSFAKPRHAIVIRELSSSPKFDVSLCRLLIITCLQKHELHWRSGSSRPHPRGERINIDKRCRLCAIYWAGCDMPAERPQFIVRPRIFGSRLLLASGEPPCQFLQTY